MQRVAAITIDVDSLRFYLQIHGLEALPPEEDPIYTVAMPRFFELIEAAGVPATLFLIGEDAARHEARLRPLRNLGCEAASHSHTHDYSLFTRSPAEIDRELARAEAAIAPLAPTGVVGFRAPGYNTSPALLSALLSRGYAYDSSLLPAPSYWAARAAAIARYRYQGRRSASSIGDPRAFAGPVEPYRTTPARYFRRRRRGPLVELPMAVLPGLRLPLIGTSWVLMPRAARRAALAPALLGLRCLVFEMHAIDLLDASDPGIPAALAAAQPDLRVSVREKLEAFGGLFRRLADSRPVHTLRHISLQL